MSSRPSARQPNFFLVGASRSGTTSLWRYLMQHPDVYLPSADMSAKEPSYFCDDRPVWAARFSTWERYLELFAPATTEHAIGEASTPYLVSPESPGRIRATYPDARVLIVLRNPADRAFSLYRYLCLLGVESVPTFERALAIEDARTLDEAFRTRNPFWYPAYLYFRTGLYSAQVRRYLETFPGDQVHVMLHDDLERDPVGESQAVYRFLGVDPGFTPDAVRYNESAAPFSVVVQHWLGRDWDNHPMHPGQDASPWGRLRRRAYQANVRAGRWRRMRLDPGTRTSLLERYREDIAATADLLGRPLDHWLAPRRQEGHRSA